MVATRKVAALIVAIIVLLWPIRYLASPQWDVVTVNRDGSTYGGVNVRLVYVNYSVETNSHEVTLRSDSNGHVFFPAIYDSASLLARGFYMASAATDGIHASFGRHAHVFAFGTGVVETVGDGTDWQGSPAAMQSKIVVRSNMEF
jgi:hypothetical protein